MLLLRTYPIRSFSLSLVVGLYYNLFQINSIDWIAFLINVINIAIVFLMSLDARCKFVTSHITRVGLQEV